MKATTSCHTAHYVKTIAGLSKNYFRDCLTEEFENRERYLQDWYEALHHFFSKSFYRGRLDSVSVKIQAGATIALDQIFGPDSATRTRKLSRLSRNGWIGVKSFNSRNNPILHALKDEDLARQESDETDASIPVRNKHDRKMVLTVLGLCSDLSDHDHNIARWAVPLIRQGKIEERKTPECIMILAENVGCKIEKSCLYDYQYREWKFITTQGERINIDQDDFSDFSEGQSPDVDVKIRETFLKYVGK